MIFKRIIKNMVARYLVLKHTTYLDKSMTDTYEVSWKPSEDEYRRLRNK
jgi:hypothetical protein